MSFLDAAERVLGVHSKGQPMHYQEIARLAVEQGLVHTQGRTPAATLNAQVGVEIGRRRARGEPQRFTPCRTGTSQRSSLARDDGDSGAPTC